MGHRTPERGYFAAPEAMAGTVITDMLVASTEADFEQDHERTYEEMVELITAAAAHSLDSYGIRPEIIASMDVAALASEFGRAITAGRSLDDNAAATALERSIGVATWVLASRLTVTFGASVPITRLADDRVSIISAGYDKAPGLLGFLRRGKPRFIEVTGTGQTCPECMVSPLVIELDNPLGGARCADAAHCGHRQADDSGIAL